MKNKGMMKELSGILKIGQKLLRIIYPRRCPLCHDIIAKKDERACVKCLKELPLVHGVRCKRCSKPITTEAEYCFDCSSKKHFFEEGYSVLIYNNKMQKSMTYFKLYGRREYGDFYAELLLHFARRIVKRWDVEVILPVPIHRRKRNVRGYNQTEIIGRVLSRGFSIPIRTDLVKRVKNTKAQKELNISERKKNVKGVFEVGAEVSKYRHVLIVDDIYTTGSTVDEIAKELKKKGVEKVFFLTVCIGHGF